MLGHNWGICMQNMPTDCGAREASINDGVLVSNILAFQASAHAGSASACTIMENQWACHMAHCAENPDLARASQHERY